jgi:hypothetical protein
MGHHYAPRKYLLGFCEPGHDGWLWVYDRKYQKYKRKHVGAVAQEKGFYSDEDEANLNLAVETPANPVLDKLREGLSITDDERGKLAAYIATTIYRVPHRRDLSLSAASMLFEQTIEERRQWILREAERQKPAPEKVERKLKQLEEFREQHAANPAALIPDVMRKPWPSDLACRLVHGMTWRLIASTGPTFFITTDNPAAFDLKFGLGQKCSEMVFPLSSGLLLHGWWQPGRQYEKIAADAATVDALNQRMASMSSRYIFYHKKDDAITALASTCPLDGPNCEPV